MDPLTTILEAVGAARLAFLKPFHLVNPSHGLIPATIFTFLQPSLAPLLDSLVVEHVQLADPQPHLHLHLVPLLPPLGAVHQVQGEP